MIRYIPSQLSTFKKNTLESCCINGHIQIMINTITWMFLQFLSPSKTFIQNLLLFPVLIEGSRNCCQSWNYKNKMLLKEFIYKGVGKDYVWNDLSGIFNSRCKDELNTEVKLFHRNRLNSN
jgi:hypothetical protein